MPPSMLHHTASTAPHHNSCMAPQMSMPNFMGVSTQSGALPSLQASAQTPLHIAASSPHLPQPHHLSQSLNQQPSQLASTHLTPPLSPPLDSSSTNNGVNHASVAATAALSAAVTAAGVMDYGSYPTERRSSSIACLRLKAREHSVAAMGLGFFNAYGK